MWLKPYIEFNTHIKTRSRKKWRQRRKSIAQINEQCCIRQNGGKPEKQNRCKASKQRKRVFKMYIKSKLHVTHFTISYLRHEKAKLHYNPAYIVRCVLEMSEVFMYEFHYDYIKNKYNDKSKLLFTETDNVMYEIKTEYVFEGFSRNKEIFDFSNYSTKFKY